MGLFSRLTNNKQESASVDSGYYSADDKAAGAAARSKRASNAGGAARRNARPAVDPVLPEKKRARRRLVGAIALALAVAIGLPMILDSEPKPLSSDISYQIPSKDKPADAPAPVVADAAPTSAPKTPAKVDDRAALDQSEEIVAPPKNPAPAKNVTAPVVAEVRAHTDEPKTARTEVKTEPRPEPKVSKPVEPKVVKAEPEPKPEPKPVAKMAPKADLDDNARAMAILEGKSAVKPAEAAAGGRFVVQVASLASRDKVDELQNKLREAGIHSYTQKVSSGAGELTRIRVGPLSKDEAENVRAKLGKIGLSGRLEPTS
jgi:DedD protein